MTDTPLSLALRTICETTRLDTPMASYICREVNLYLDVIRTEGKREIFSLTDLHVLFTRLHDLAQVQPLVIPEQPVVPVNLDKLEQETNHGPGGVTYLKPGQVPFGKPTSLTLSRPAPQAKETPHEP